MKVLILKETPLQMSKKNTDMHAAKAAAGDENSSAKKGQCLKCDFKPSFKERVNPRISEGTV